MADAKLRASAKKSDSAAGAENSGNDSGRGTGSSNSKRSSRASTTTRGTTKKPNRRPTTTAKTTGTDRRTSSRARTAPHNAPVQPSTAPRKVTMGSRTRSTSLRSDLQKYGKESYAPEDFMLGTELIIDAGAGNTLRDLVSSVLHSKGAFGNMQSEHAMEGLLDLLTKGYTKRRVAERKSLRAMLNWCSGLAETDPEVEGELLRVVLSHGADAG